jgi:photosystem II stability/assembly factor-like uncharacterized protein
MRIINKITGGSLLLIVLAACNLTSPVNKTSIPWDTLRVDSPTGTIPSGGHIVPTPTATPVTLTITPTPTNNPLAVPRLEVGSAIDILRLEMLDAQNGWGVGGPRASGNSSHVFRTQDGGSSWMEVTPPEVAASESDVSSMAAVGFFPDPQTGWVTYHANLPTSVPLNPVVWKTTDGGRTWKSSSPLSTAGLMETFSVSDITFSDANYGWVLVHVGAGMNHDYIALYRSTDGGQSWSRVIDPDIDGGIQSCSKTGLAFSNGSAGWLTGNCNGVRAGAFLFQTADGGTHWDPVTLPAPADHPDLFTADQYACAVHAPVLQGNQAFLGVECADMSSSTGLKIGYLYRVASGGSIDSRAYPGGDIFTLDGSRIWALGLEIYRSDSAGESWAKISTVTWEGQFDFVSATLGWAAVKKGSEYGLVQTTDGGGIWVQLSPVTAAGP